MPTDLASVRRTWAGATLVRSGWLTSVYLSLLYALMVLSYTPFALEFPNTLVEWFEMTLLLALGLYFLKSLGMSGSFLGL